MDIKIVDLNQNLVFNKTTTDTINTDSDLRGFDDKKRKQVFIDFAKDVAYEYRRRLIKAVESQSLAKYWKPLNPAYLAYKRKKGLSTKIWKATGTLINSIVVNVTPSRIEVGVSYTAKEPESGEYCRIIAKEMEYGTSRKPPRPLFGPVKRQLEKDLPALYLKYIFGKYGKSPIPEQSTQSLKNKQEKFNSIKKEIQENDKNKIYNLTGRKIGSEGIPVEYISNAKKVEINKPIGTVKKY